MRVVLIGRYHEERIKAARYLRQQYGFTQLNFDDGVRRLTMLLYSLSHFRKIKPGQKKAIYEALYAIDPDIWLTYVVSRTLKARTHFDIVVPDPKYINEVQKLKEIGFVVVRISTAVVKKNVTFSVSKLVGKKHREGNLALSEYLDKNLEQNLGVDYSIYNDSDESLFKGLDTIIEKIKSS